VRRRRRVSTDAADEPEALDGTDTLAEGDEDSTNADPETETEEAET